MQFKQWLLENDLANSSSPDWKTDAFNVAKNVSSLYKQPMPTEYIAHGVDAVVFKTTNPQIVARVTSHKNDGLECIKVIKNPQMQKTGGVNKILGSYQDPKTNQEVTYKEFVNTNWQPLLKNITIDASPLKNIDANYIVDDKIPDKFPFTELFSGKKYTEIIETNLGRNKLIEFLRSLNIPQLNNLIKAIQIGLPVTDLHDENIALDKNNNLIAIDC